MATLTAHQRIDNSGTMDLDLAKITNVSENDLNHDIQYTSGQVHLDLHSSLDDLQFAGGVFFAGTIDTVTETKGGQPSYELTTIFKLEDFYDAQTGNVVAAFVNNLFSGNDHIQGSKKSDVLFGFLGDDRVIGGKGADVVSGGPGLDTLTGGKGGDTFRFDAFPEGSTNIDTITDFKHGQDKLAFSAGLFSPLNTGSDHIKSDFFQIGKHAADDNDFLIYNKGKLFYDHDAAGGDKQVLIATLSHHPTLSVHDLELLI